MAVAESSFAMDETGRKIGEKQFGFGTFLQFALFDWMKTFNINVNWKKMEEINEAKD